jgi:hypothetical protein
MVKHLKIITEHATYYYLGHKYHRENSPAIEYVNGDKEWWIHGKRHREDGPAKEYNDGRKFWYLQGEEYSEEEYFRVLKLKTLW